MRRSEIDAALQAIYDQVPAMLDCQGKCWASCGPVEMSLRERQRIRQAGYRITEARTAMTSPVTFWCEALTGDGRCAVYGLRPLVCRLWGAVEDMPCPFGCRPVRMLSSEEGWRLVVESLDAGGDPTGLIDSYGGPDVLMELWRADVRGLRQVYAEQMTRGERGVALRIASAAGRLPAEVARRRKLLAAASSLDGEL